MMLQALFSVTALLIACQPAFAITTLKKVQVTDGSRVDVFFDGKVSPAQIKTEYFNDIIQLSISDVSVYPAKISSISGTELTKVFAYQYAPKLVRFRLSVRGKAEDYRNRVRINPNGKHLSIRLEGGQASRSTQSDEVMYGASAAVRNAASGRGDQSPPARAANKKPAEQEEDADEKALRERVLKSAASANTSRKDEAPSSKPGDKKALAGGKPIPSPFRALGTLAIVIATMCGALLILRKLKRPDIQNHKGLSSLISKITGLNSRKKMIEVVATHHLGPKKSIAVVRVAGRQLVLGITNESINLITQIGNDAIGDAALEDSVVNGLQGDPMPEDIFKPEPSSKGAGAQAAGPAIFSDLLAGERSKPSDTIRAKIRSRVEGMKPL